MNKYSMTTVELVEELGQIVISPSVSNLCREIGVSNRALLVVNVFFLLVVGATVATGADKHGRFDNLIGFVIIWGVANAVLCADRLATQKWNKGHGKIAISRETHEVKGMPDGDYVGTAQEIRVYTRWRKAGGYFQARLVILLSSGQEYVVMDSPRYAESPELHEITIATGNVRQRWSPVQEDWWLPTDRIVGMTTGAIELVDVARITSESLKLPCNLKDLR
ncbi:MAG TPA: hypothetical protein VGK19_23520 [Capsulimonadaceae bacterium]|jgi:hypothetical protein